MAKAPRQSLIEQLKNEGYTSTEINNEFIARGLPALTTEERKGLPILGEQGLGQTLLKGGVRNVEEIKSGIPTFLGFLGKAIHQPRAAWDYISPIFTDPRNLINIPLGQYNIDTGRIGQSLTGGTGARLSLDDILYGLANNPLFAAADLAPVGAAALKGLGKVTGVGSKIKSVKQMNKILNQATLAGDVVTMPQQRALEGLSRKFNALSRADREAISMAVQQTGATDLGSKKLNNILKEVKDLSKESTNMLVKRGLIDEALNQQNVIANYIGNNLGWNKVTHADIMDKIKDPTKLTGKMKDLYEQGLSHYNEGNIAFISQAVNPSEGILGSPITKAPNYYEQPRVLGTQTPLDMADFIPQALERQSRYAGGMIGAEDLLKSLANYTSPVTDKNAIQLSKAGLKNLTREAVKSGATPNEVIRRLPKATEAEIKAGQAISIPRTEYNMLTKFGTSTKGSDLLSTWKRSVLGGPKWFAENRIGNLQSNLIEGVTPVDTLKALVNFKKAPRELDALTKAYGYAQDVGVGTGNVFKEAIDRMRLGGEGVIANLKDQELGRALKSAGEIPLGFADLVSKPIFNLEAYFDKLERFSNLNKQIRRVAKQEGKTVKELEKEIAMNPSKFSEVYDQVNRSMGDYYGRNYLYPTSFENFRRNVIPFSKFFTNTARVTANQLANKPIGSQLFLTGPAKLGRDIHQDLLDRGVIIDPENKGGFPSDTFDTRTGERKLIRSEGMPIQALANIAGSVSDIGQGGPEELTAITSPILGLRNVLEMKSGFGKPLTSKKWVAGDNKLYRRDEEGYVLPEEYKLSPVEYAGAVGSQLAKQFYGPAVHTREFRSVKGGLIDPAIRSFREGIPLGQAMEEAKVYPMYDVELNPFTGGDLTRTPARGPMDILGRLAGFRLYTPYTGGQGFNKQDFRKAVRRNLIKE